MRKLLVTVAAGVLATLAAGAVAAERNAPGAEAIVTIDSMALPPGCTPRETAGLLVRFFDAFNRGDRAALDGMLARPNGLEPSGSPFKWFSVEGFTAYRRDDALAYFAARHAQRERLTLLQVRVARRYDETEGAIGIVLTRVADDLQPTRVLGKGGFDCRSGRIYVWSMGADLPAVRECPGPAIAGRPLACAAQGRRPNAQELMPDFTTRRGEALPRRCAIGPVQSRVLTFLRAWNVGAGRIAARQFAPSGKFEPYTDTGGRFVGRRSIARFVAARFRRGDGWTVRAITAPSQAGGEAIYGVDLAVASRGSAFGAQGLKLIVTCRSGLFRYWLGPALRRP